MERDEQLLIVVFVSSLCSFQGALKIRGLPACDSSKRYRNRLMYFSSDPLRLPPLTAFRLLIPVFLRLAGLFRLLLPALPALSRLPRVRPWAPRSFRLSSLPRKEVIQPHLPIRLPCYDFTPVIGLTFDGCPLSVSSPASGAPNSHGVTGGVYKARERIHRDMLIRDY